MHRSRQKLPAFRLAVGAVSFIIMSGAMAWPASGRASGKCSVLSSLEPKPHLAEISQKTFLGTSLQQDYVFPVGHPGATPFQRTNRGYQDLREEWIRHIKSSMFSQSHQKSELKEFLEVLDLRRLQGQTILDAGTGDGRFVEDLRNAGVIVYGLDLVLRDQQKAKEYFIEGDATSTGLPPQTFDLVISAYSVFHYNDPFQPHLYKMALKEFARILKPGGKLLVLNALYGVGDIYSSRQFRPLYPDPKWKSFASHLLLVRKP